MRVTRCAKGGSSCAPAATSKNSGICRHSKPFAPDRISPDRVKQGCAGVQLAGCARCVRSGEPSRRLAVSHRHMTGGAADRRHHPARGDGGRASFRPWCATCPLRPSCTASRRGRTIAIHPKKRCCSEPAASSVTQPGKSATAPAGRWWNARSPTSPAAPGTGGQPAPAGWPASPVTFSLAPQPQTGPAGCPRTRSRPSRLGTAGHLTTRTLGDHPRQPRHPASTVHNPAGRPPPADGRHRPPEADRMQPRAAFTSAPP
jgi:hypothetical protein